MKISYINKKFDNTALDALRAKCYGTAEAILTADDSSFKIRIIKNGLTEGIEVTREYRLLEVEFSKNIEPQVRTLLETYAPDFGKACSMEGLRNDNELTNKIADEQYQVKDGDTVFKLFVPINKLNVFYGLLQKIDASITPEQLKQLVAFLHPNNGKLSDFKLFSAAKEKDELTVYYMRNVSKLEDGLAKLIDDLLLMPASNNTNKMIRNAFQGVYSDLDTQLSTPAMTLIEHLKEVGAKPEVISKADKGEYDHNRITIPGISLSAKH